MFYKFVDIMSKNLGNKKAALWPLNESVAPFKNGKKWRESLKWQMMAFNLCL